MDMITDASRVARYEAARQLRAVQRCSSGEFLIFRLAAMEYGIDILKVQEIRSYEPPTRIAHAPPFVKGVVTLRGVVVPIVDLRLKLGCVSAAYNAFTVVIVLNVHGRVVGAVVDSVSDVLALRPHDIHPAPQPGAAADTRFVTGIGRVGERMLVLANVEVLLAGSDTDGLLGSD